MSLSLLKRELELEIENIDQKNSEEHKKVDKKAKLDKKVKGDKSKEKKTQLKKSSFKFNNKDYTKEDDYTEQCLRNLGRYISKFLIPKI